MNAANNQRSQVDLGALIGENLTQGSQEPREAPARATPPEPPEGDPGEALEGRVEPSGEVAEVMGQIATPPPSRIPRVTVSYDVPTVARIPERIADCARETGMEKRNIAALALDEYLKQHGY